MPSLKFDIEELGLGSPEDSEGNDKPWKSVWNVLTNYVQPDSNLSLDEAIDLTAEFYEDGLYKSCPITRISIFLGERIPYDNPAHTKLANYLIALGHSLKWVPKTHYSGENDETVFYNLLGDYLFNHRVDLEDEVCNDGTPGEPGEDPALYVNAEAFAANFMSRDLISKHFPAVASYLEESMNEAFNRDHSEETPEVRDARVMGAAQWIIWKAEEAFSLVQKPWDPEIEEVGTEKCYFWQKTQRTDAPIKTWRYKRTQWQGWEARFRAVVKDEAYGRTCRNLAERAADLMSLQEKGLENSQPPQ